MTLEEEVCDSLRVGFEVSKAHSRPSPPCPMPMDQDVKADPILFPCCCALHHDDDGLSSEVVSRPPIKCSHF